MYATRLFKLLLVALSIVCVAQASWIDLNKIHLNERRIVRRQSPSQQASEDTQPSATVPADEPSATDAAPEDTAVPTQSDTQPTATDTVDTAQPSEQPSDEPSQPSATAAPSTADDPVETTAAEESATDAAPSTAAERSTAANTEPTETAAAPTHSDATDDTDSTIPSATDDSTAAQSTDDAPEPTATSTGGSGSGSSSRPSNDDSSNTDTWDEASSTAEDGETMTTARPVTSTHIAVVTRTNSEGDLETMTSTSITTSTPGLSSDDDDSSSGMSTKTRNTVIGVVVGIGGAIVVGALGLVAWRIWGRKKHTDEADGLMDFHDNNSGTIPNLTNGPYHGVEKTEYGGAAAVASGPPRSPFQSTLDTYHQPTPVNASSNF
ncbi:hypothetical protein F66182_6758 [Fusarium sp. NRRL 66182]|nr:hypothetical protein F66182_6758 [Fusarium sp. NRRL 66182]